ncbi:MAG: TonB family protein [Opitutaceae bacterium]|nr:TonB family protein [Opitutaceae bacterium]
MLSDGDRRIAAPKDAKWRLEGGLRENAALLDVSPNYSIHRVVRHNEEPADRPPMRASCGTGHRLTSRVPDLPAESVFLRSWPEGTPVESLVVMVWMTGETAARVETRVIPPTDHNEFSTGVLWEMDEKEAADGRAVMLLWRDGKFIEPAPWAGDSPAQRAAVEAVLFDDEAKLRGLIAAGLDVTKARHQRGMTLLHLAAEAGSVRTLDALVRASPRLIKMGAEGSGGAKNITALHWAAPKGRLAAVRRLIAAKADVNAEVALRNPQGWNSAITAAVQSGHIDVVAALLEAGAKTRGGWRDGPTVLDDAILNGDCAMADLVLRERRGDQKLLRGVEHGDSLRIQLRTRRAPMIEWLLRHGIKIRRDDVTGRMLTGSRSVSRLPEIVPSSKTAGRTYSTGRTYSAATYKTDEKQGVWRGILENAARPDDEALAGLLFEACSDLMEADIPDPPMRTNARRTQVRLLLEAARTGYVHLIRKFLDAGVLVSERDTDGYTCLHYAGGEDQLDAVLLLLERGATLNMVNNNGVTPLEWALQHGSAKVAREFAKRGARINLGLKQAEGFLADAIRLDIPELMLAARASGFPASGKLFDVWTFGQTARFFDASECLKALEGLSEEKTAEGAGLTRIAKPDELDAPVYVVKEGKTNDPRNFYAARPEMTVMVTALAEPGGGARLCTVKDAGVPRDMRVAAINAVRTSRMSIPKADGDYVGVTVKIPVLFEKGEDDMEPRVVAQMGVRPQIDYQPGPEYPFSAWRNGEKGVAWLRFTVTENGSVENVDTVRATDRAFAEAACRAVVNWKFAPGLLDGKPARTTMAIPIVFGPR